MTVGQLNRRMSSREFSEWVAYEKVTGKLGPDRDDVHAGIVASTIANVNKTKRGKTYKPKDFIPEWDQKEQTVDEQIATVKQIHNRLARKHRKSKSKPEQPEKGGQNGNHRGADGQDRD